VGLERGPEARRTDTGQTQAGRLCHQKGSRGGGKGPEQIEKMTGEKIGGQKGKGGRSEKGKNKGNDQDLS